MANLLAQPAIKSAISQIGGAAVAAVAGIAQGVDFTPTGGFAAFLNAHAYLLPWYVLGVSIVHNYISAMKTNAPQLPVTIPPSAAITHAAVNSDSNGKA